MSITTRYIVDIMILADQLSSEMSVVKPKSIKANRMKTRASAASDRTDAFFSCFDVNRFFYDAVKTTTNKSLKQVADQLLLPEQQIKKYLLLNHLPVVLRYLRAGCNAIDSRLGPAPPVYCAYWDSVRRDYLFGDEAIELVRPISPHHFDYTALMMSRFSSMTAERMKLFTSDWVDRSRASPYFPRRKHFASRYSPRLPIGDQDGARVHPMRLQ